MELSYGECKMVIIDLSEYNPHKDYNLEKMAKEQKGNLIEYFINFLETEYGRLYNELEQRENEGKRFDLNKHNNTQCCRLLINQIYVLLEHYQER